MKVYEQEKNSLSSENRILKSRLAEIEDKFNRLSFEHNSTLQKIRDDTSYLIAAKEDAIIKLSLEKQSLSDYWINEFERLKEDRDRQ